MPLPRPTPRRRTPAAQLDVAGPSGEHGVDPRVAHQRVDGVRRGVGDYELGRPAVSQRRRGEPVEARSENEHSRESDDRDEGCGSRRTDRTASPAERIPKSGDDRRPPTGRGDSARRRPGPAPLGGLRFRSGITANTVTTAIVSTAVTAAASGRRQVRRETGSRLERTACHRAARRRRPTRCRRQ